MAEWITLGVCMVSIRMSLSVKPTRLRDQGLSHNLETGCLKLAIVKILGVQIFKGGNNIPKFQP